jgi:hypothetical protein
MVFPELFEGFVDTLTGFRKEKIDYYKPKYQLNSNFENKTCFWFNKIKVDIERTKSNNANIFNINNILHKK